MIAFVQVVTAIGFPNFCRFIDNRHPAVNSQTDEGTTWWNIDFPWLLSRCMWLLTVNFLLLQFAWECRYPMTKNCLNWNIKAIKMWHQLLLTFSNYCEALRTSRKFCRAFTFSSWRRPFSVFNPTSSYNSDNWANPTRTGTAKSRGSG